MNTGVIIAVFLLGGLIGFVAGQNTKCLTIFGATTCVVSNPLK